MRPRIETGARRLAPALFAILAGATIVLSPGTTENAKANGETRTIYLHHAHTHESIAATFMVDGQYDSAVLDKLNWFLRDWRRDEPTHMDPRLFDVIWSVYRESGSAQPIEVMSAYRSPETNAMLRRRSRSVAEHSQHILGKAMDQHYVDVPMSRIRELAMKLQRGGVGFYPTAGTPFVHMDVGGVRHWPRMSYDQLSRLFPDGKTVHIPSNGQPLAGYEEARAELEARGDSFNYPTAGEVKSKGFFAWLFGGGDDEDDAAASARPSGGRRSGQQRMAAIDANPSGSIGGTGLGVMSGKDAGVHAFTMGSGTASGPYGAAPQRPVQATAPVEVAAVEPQPVAERPDPRAEQALAEAMAKREAAKPTETAAAPAEASAEAATLAATPAVATSAEPIVDPTVSPFIPMPPRRPVELASAGPVPPLPPGRPPQVAGLGAPVRGVAPPAAAKDAISALLDPTLGRTGGSPSIVGRGAAPQIPPSQVLAFAAPSPPAPLATQIAVPIPAPRPNFVPARLDRSNFRVLTGNGDTVRTSPKAGLGSPVGALRSAVKTNLSALAGQTTPGAAIGFARQVPDLPTDHFSTGKVSKPRDRVVTSIGATPIDAD